MGTSCVFLLYICSNVVERLIFRSLDELFPIVRKLNIKLQTQSRRWEIKCRWWKKTWTVPWDWRNGLCTLYDLLFIHRPTHCVRCIWWSSLSTTTKRSSRPNATTLSRSSLNSTLVNPKERPLESTVPITRRVSPSEPAARTKVVPMSVETPLECRPKLERAKEPMVSVREHIAPPWRVFPLLTGWCFWIRHHPMFWDKEWTNSLALESGTKPPHGQV